MDKFKWRDTEEFGDKSNYVKAKVLKSRLYFLNHPRELGIADVHRHVCRECRRVFHKMQGLEWHMIDEHPHLVKEVQRDLARISACEINPPVKKKILPNEEAVRCDKKLCDLHLEHEEDEVTGKEHTLKECYVKLEKLKLVEMRDAHNNLKNDGPDDNDDPVIVEIDSKSSVEDLMNNLSTQECYVNLEKLELVEMLDTNNNLKNDGPDDNDDPVIVEIDSKSSVEDLNNLSTQPKPLQHAAVAGVPDNMNLPLSSAQDKVQWWLQKI